MTTTDSISSRPNKNFVSLHDELTLTIVGTFFLAISSRFIDCISRYGRLRGRHKKIVLMDFSFFHLFLHCFQRRIKVAEDERTHQPEFLFIFLFVVQPIFIRTRNIRVCVVTLYMYMYILTNHNL